MSRCYFGRKCTPYIFDVWQEDMTTNIEIGSVTTPYFDGEKYVLQPFCMSIASILRHYP